MENRPPSPKKVGDGERAKGKAPPPDLETRLLDDPSTPDEHDPLWNELGSTRVMGQDEKSDDGELSAPANLTPVSPSPVLGKDVVTLGDYKLLKKVGEGAMGVVYKARQLTSNRVVALKVLFPHIANNPKLVKRFYREGRVMGMKLDHPNIISAYAVDEFEGWHFVAMEYVSGQSAQKCLEQLGRLPVEDSVRIVIDCAKALAYAHGLEIVHRDIKPDNIMLTKTGMVKVADLGMVKTHDDDMSLTQTGHAVGTPWYMPLEQARNAKSIDGRSDIYALGCTLYAFLTGRPPFHDEALADVIRAKERGTFPPARQVNDNVPERLDLILAKMTAKTPEKRYQRCEDLIKDLESLNLASTTLSFIATAESGAAHAKAETAKVEHTKAVDRSEQAGYSPPGETAPSNVDANIWYVQKKGPDGTPILRKCTTSELQRLLESDAISPNVRVSHSPTEGFRSAATFKEFQGTALSKMTKKAADKQGARYRQQYKKLEEEERQRELQDVVKKEDDARRASLRYWAGVALVVVPLVGAVILLVYGIIWLARNFLQ